MASSNDLMGEVQKFAEGGFVPPSMGATELNTPGMMQALNNAPRSQNNQGASYRTPQMTGLEEFEQSQPISEEVSKQMRVLDMAKRGASLVDMSKALGIGLADVANIIAGSASLLVTEGVALAGDVSGLISGGGDLSKTMFEESKSLRDLGRDTFLPDVDVNNIDQSAGLLNFAPRLVNNSGNAELGSNERAQIEMDSLRNISDGMVAGDEALFAEGAPVEQLGGDLPSSIIQSRNMSPPSTPRFSGAGDGPQSLSSPQMTNQELGFDGLVDEMAVESARRAPSLPGYDVSTGVPKTMNEVSGSVLAERENAAAAGLGNPQPRKDRFSQEDRRIAAQDAELSDIRSRQLSDNERLQMTGIEREPTPTTMPNTAEAEAMIDNDSTMLPAEDGVTSSPRPQLRPQDFEGITNSDDSPEIKSHLVAQKVLSTATGKDVNLGPKESVKAYEKLFSEMLGMKDKDSEKEVWHNMAMIGFAIAAGESPNALSNIANGMLAGTKMMKDDRNSKQARQDKISMLALAESNEDRRLDARLRSAESIAEMRQSGAGNEMRNFKSPIDAIQAESARIADEIEMGTVTLEDGQTVQSLAVDNIIPVYTAMGVDMSKFSALGSGKQALTMQETEEAAKASGAKVFSFGGNRYNVR